LVRDSLLYTDGAAPSLLVVDEAGSQARSIQVPVPALDVRDAWDSLRTVMAATGRAERLNDFPEAAALEPIPVIGEVLLDSNDQVWLKHYNPSTDSYLVRGGPLFHGGRWSVLTRDGRVVAEVQMPAGFAPLDISDESIAGVYRDSLGVEYVWVLDLQK
jgi:hypothetical protein